MSEEIEDALTYEELEVYSKCLGSTDFETMEYDLKRMAKELLELRKERAWQPTSAPRQEMGG